MTGPAVGDGGLVRPHVRTGGRTTPSREELRLESLVTTAETPGPPHVGLNPDEKAVLDVCRPDRAMSVSEIAAHLGQPPTLAKILVSGLADSGLVGVSTPPDTTSGSLLERVLHGLRALPA
ncbi:DUF742 domain-containing protein [Streptomyces sp. NPDC001890]|uniref:DUF742 domain-containing protein n=1 Tax=Streptomyces sp. NPDC001890 TaxID=3364620 RepID=UPI0036A77073